MANNERREVRVNLEHVHYGPLPDDPDMLPTDQDSPSLGDEMVAGMATFCDSAEGRSGEGVMDSDRREAIEAAGFRVGDAGDFLGLTDAERQMVDRKPLPAELAAKIRRFWEKHGDAVRMQQAIGEAIRDAVAAERERCCAWLEAESDLFDREAASPGSATDLDKQLATLATRIRGDALRTAARLLREGDPH